MVKKGVLLGPRIHSSATLTPFDDMMDGGKTRRPTK